MTNYSDNPGHVRCEQFKPGGKWYQTFEIDMSEYYNEVNIYDAVRFAILDLLDHLNQKAYERKLREPDSWPAKVERKTRERLAESMQGWTWVVFDPYHRNAYPVCIPATHEYDPHTKSYQPIREES